MKICTLCKREFEDAYRVCPIDGLALQEVAGSGDPNEKVTIPNVQLGEKIADGRLGPIYRAMDAARGLVAVQIVNKEVLSNEVLSESFQEAVKLATRLEHAHIVRTFGFETASDGTGAVLMEYVA